LNYYYQDLPPWQTFYLLPLSSPTSPKKKFVKAVSL